MHTHSSSLLSEFQSEADAPSRDEERTDLLAYARKHRYRTRNLHDGHPVPPAIVKKTAAVKSPGRVGYVGSEDRMDVVVGSVGYLIDEGDGVLGICLFYKSAKGVKRGTAGLEAIGGTVMQAGDTEVAGTVPFDRIEEALQLIKVSKLRPGNPANLNRDPVQEACGS